MKVEETMSWNFITFHLPHVVSHVTLSDVDIIKLYSYCVNREVSSYAAI